MRGKLAFLIILVSLGLLSACSNPFSQEPPGRDRSVLEEKRDMDSGQHVDQWGRNDRLRGWVGERHQGYTG